MKTTIAIILILLCLAPVRASWKNDFGFQGYVREMPIVWKPPSYFGGGSSYRLDNLIHARENVRWYPANPLRIGMDLKVRLFTGKSSKELDAETDYSQFGATYFNWTHRFIDENHAVLSATVDRGWVDWTQGPLEVTAGRQRIAWGTSLVWNPIDLFNPSSPFDFDGEELPGTDAGRVQWYLGPSSKLEAGIAPQRDADNTIAAVKLLLNKWDYDWIIVVGRRHAQAVFGGAWAGSILKGGFRGEFLYAVPCSSASYSDAYLTATIDGDYTFRNTLYLHASVLYNGLGTTGDAGGLILLESLQLGELTPSKLNLFAEIARDLSPLVHGDLSAIINPYDGSWYLGPSLTYSVATNLDLTGMALLFFGNSATEFGSSGEIILARLRYAF